MKAFKRDIVNEGVNEGADLLVLVFKTEETEEVLRHLEFLDTDFKTLDLPVMEGELEQLHNDYFKTEIGDIRTIVVSNDPVIEVEESDCNGITWTSEEGIHVYYMEEDVTGLFYSLSELDSPEVSDSANKHSRSTNYSDKIFTKEEMEKYLELIDKYEDEVYYCEDRPGIFLDGVVDDSDYKFLEKIHEKFQTEWIDIVENAGLEWEGDPEHTYSSDSGHSEKLSGIPLDMIFKELNRISNWYS